MSDNTGTCYSRHVIVIHLIALFLLKDVLLGSLPRHRRELDAILYKSNVNSFFYKELHQPLPIKPTHSPETQAPTLAKSSTAPAIGLSLPASTAATAIPGLPGVGLPAASVAPGLGIGA